eukprot:SAG11_NODE_253_length_11591_cov_15.933693_5_plen_109_part_00
MCAILRLKAEWATRALPAQVFDQKDLLGRLPDTIAIPLMKEMYRKVIEPVAFLARLEDETLSAVCLLMQPMSVLPNDYICKGTESVRLLPNHVLGTNIEPCCFEYRAL